MEKFLWVIFMLTMLFICTSCSNDDLSRTENYNEKTAQETNDEKSVEDGSLLYDKLIQSFIFSGNTKRGTDNEIQYPDYYGGSYVNDNGDLVVCIIENKIKSVNQIKSNVRKVIGANGVIFKTVDYSFNYLNGIMNTLNEYVISNNTMNKVENINAFYYSQIDNCIIVELDNCNENVIQNFKNKVIDSPAIKFKNAEMEIKIHANLYGGGQIWTGSSGGSIGYRVKLGNDVGIITAGHVASVNDAIYNSSKSTQIGICSKSQQSGSIDAAFCRISGSSYVPTNTIKIGTTLSTLSTTISEPGEGTSVNYVGYTSGRKSGVVKYTNVTIYKEGRPYITNLTFVKTTSSNGDSGGIFYSYVSSTNTRYTLGILLGDIPLNGVTGTLYSKANQINKAFGTVRY